MADSDRKVSLTLLIKSAGAKEAEADIKKLGTTTTSLQSELGKLSRADQLQKLGSEMGALAQKTGDVSGAVKDLSTQLNALGATKDEIREVAQAFNEAQSGGGGGNGPGGNFLQRAGSGLRSLPSVQIPGAGIGTDAIGNITRLTGALGEASGVMGLVTQATTALTPALGATAAGFAGATLVLGPLVLLIGALGLALKGLADESAKQEASINRTVDAQRKVNEQIAAGLTTQDAQKQLDDLNRKRQEEADLLARNQQIYDENINNQGILSGVLKATSGAEEGLSNQINTSKKNVEDYDAQIAALTRAVENGSLAANDAAEAEKKLAEERTKAVLDAADVAGKELAAQQKALNATEEQNLKRLDSIEDEKAVLQKQIDVLTESGDTSEEVTAKIAALNGQLGSLGKESEFIKNTALEASRQADAEKKAQKDAEDAAKKAEQAQASYTKSIANAEKQFAQSTQDIGTKLRNTLIDNQTKFNRDLDDLGTKFRRDEFDIQLKANRAERDAALDQQADLAKIREDGSKEEQDAIREGDFKALFLARQKQQESIKQEQSTINSAALKRQLDYKDAREDALRAAERQRSDRMRSYERQTVDARLAQDRELAQARLTRQRALQAASEGLNAELALHGQYWNARLKQTQQALNQLNGIQANGGQASTRTPLNMQGATSFPQATGKFIASVLRR